MAFEGSSGIQPSWGSNPVMGGPIQFNPGQMAPTGSPVQSGGANINPTGANGSGGIMPSWGSTPPTGGGGNYGYGIAGNPNPTMSPHAMTGGTGPTTSMNPGGPSTPTGSGLSNAGNNWQSFTNELGKIYGKGVGSELYGFLDSGAGYNSALTQQSIDAQIQAMQHQAQTGYGALSSNMGASGISPNSSAAALESGDYWSNVTAAENAITAQEYYNMWNSSMNREAGILGGIMGDAAHHKENQFNLLDYLSNNAQAGAQMAMMAMAA
jgi:hypothetical protein